MTKSEPVMVATLAALLVSLAARHGVKLPTESAADVLQCVITLAMAWWARSRVSPVKPAP